MQKKNNVTGLLKIQIFPWRENVKVVITIRFSNSPASVNGYLIALRNVNKEMNRFTHNDVISKLQMMKQCSIWLGQKLLTMVDQVFVTLVILAS